MNLICVPDSHFDLDYYGGPGIAITPTVNGSDATVKVETFVTNLKEGQTIRYTVYDAQEKDWHNSSRPTRTWNLN